jgi:hypothetical protein
MLTARLPVALETQLNHYAATYGMSKSFVVQEAIQDYLLRRSTAPSSAATLPQPATAPSQHQTNGLLALSRELADKYPGVEVDWREARDEGRK